MKRRDRGPSRTRLRIVLATVIAMALAALAGCSALTGNGGRAGKLGPIAPAPDGVGFVERVPGLWGTSARPFVPFGTKRSCGTGGQLQLVEMQTAHPGENAKRFVAGGACPNEMSGVGHGCCSMAGSPHTRSLQAQSAARASGSEARGEGGRSWLRGFR